MRLGGFFLGGFLVISNFPNRTVIKLLTFDHKLWGGFVLSRQCLLMSAILPAKKSVFFAAEDILFFDEMNRIGGKMPRTQE